MYTLLFIFSQLNVLNLISLNLSDFCGSCIRIQRAYPSSLAHLRQVGLPSVYGIHQAPRPVGLVSHTQSHSTA
jgi:hypothetical protein